MDDKPADSAYVPTPPILCRFVKSPKVALRAHCNVNQTAYCQSSTHVGNSLVMFYPNGDKSRKPVPGCIEHIMFEPDGKVIFTVRQQLPVPPGFVDPYVEWPHFPARVYSTSLSPSPIPHVKIEVNRAERVLLQSNRGLRYRTERADNFGIRVASM